MYFAKTETKKSRARTGTNIPVPIRKTSRRALLYSGCLKTQSAAQMCCLVIQSASKKGVPEPCASGSTRGVNRFKLELLIALQHRPSLKINGRGCALSYFPKATRIETGEQVSVA